MIRFLIITFICFASSAFATSIKGVVKGEDGQPLSFVAVYVKASSNSTTTAEDGTYSLELKPGKYIISFSLIGYNFVDKEIIIKPGKKEILLDVILKANEILLNDLNISGKKNNIARNVMREVRDKRKYYNEKIQTLSFTTHQKISIEREVKKYDFPFIIQSNQVIDSTCCSDSNELDSLKYIYYFNLLAIVDDTDSTVLSDSIALDSVQMDSIAIDTISIDSIAKRHITYLTESINRIHYEKPSNFKVIVNAQHEYFGRETYYYGQDQLFTYALGSENAMPVQWVYSNPYVFYEDITDCDFNFYENLINYPELCEKPLLSPLALTAELNYRFVLDCSYYEGAKKIYKIKVKPNFKSDALFSGFIYIEDSTWAIKSVDFSINKHSLILCKEFNIKQEYQKLEKDTYFPSNSEITYTLRDEKRFHYGKVQLKNSDFTLNQTFPTNTFNEEVKTYESKAFDKDSIYWDTCRVFVLNKEDSLFIHESDSLKAYYQSEVFQRKTDSIVNMFKIEKVAFGYNHINRKTGVMYYIGGLMSQLKPLGLGGYRHALPLRWQKTFNNDMQFDVFTEPNYGFANKDLKGTISTRLLYIPKKFVGTGLRFGDNYRLVNNNASISQIFSRSNFVNSRFVGVTQQMEIINGLFAELSFDYTEQKSISKLILEKWTTGLFGKELNTPMDFKSYYKSEISLRLGYRYKQKFIIKRKAKIILGSKYPELSLHYRKGVKGLFNSEEDFDYLEFRIADHRKLARYGTINWQVFTGTFLNKANLQVVEHKYFRGSDPFFFSNPIESFQLLGPTLTTTNPFFQAGFIHHFDGSIFNKLPLFNKLRMDACFGAGTFSVPNKKVYHFEMFAGIDKKFRIRTQLFKIGVFAVTSDNTMDKAKFTFKVGLSTYDLFSKKWSY